MIENQSNLENAGRPRSFLVRICLKALAGALALAGVGALISRIRRVRSRNALKRTGLFDSNWYLEQYPDVAKAGLDPIEHYLRIGCKQGRKPNADFDTAWYLATYPDVGKSGLNPLLHYALYGLAEDRLYAPPEASSWIARPKPASLPSVQPGESPLRIAMQAHLYYPDLVDELLSACLNSPGDTHILATVTSQEALDAARSWADKHSFDRLDVRLVMNRGRDVAPFTTTFGPDLLARFDLLCHIHTKKASYLGVTEAGSAWRQQNIGALLGSKERASQIVNQFAARLDLGLAMPSPNLINPYWCYTLLDNGDAAKRLVDVTGIPLLMEGYLDFPAGTMFWARPDALKQLLDGRIAIGMFAPEEGQLGGTLAHAIERSLCRLCEANGYHWIEIDSATGDQYLDYCGKNLWQYAQLATYARLLRLIDRVQTVSFDIVDTLMTPITHGPGKLQTLIDKLGASALASTSSELAELVEELAKNSKLSAGQMDYLLESDQALPRSPIIQALRYAVSSGKRVILTDDSTWDKSRLEGLLAQCGITGYHEVYTPAEAGSAKDTRAFWEWVIAKEKTSPSQMLHVGDDEYSDVFFPYNAGIKCFHLLSARNLLALSPLASRLPASLRSAISVPGPLCPALAQLFADPLNGR